MIQAAFWHMLCGHVQVWICNLSSLAVCMKPATVTSANIMCVIYVPKLLVSAQEASM